MAQISLSRGWGHLGIVNAATFATMSAGGYSQQQIAVDQGDGTTKSYLSDGAAWNQIDGGGAQWSDSTGTAIIVGDSFAASEITTNSGQNTANAIGLFTTLNGWLGAPLNIRASLGVNGYKTSEWLPQISVAAAYKPKYILIFHGFANDVGQSVSAPTIISNLTSAYTQARDMGARVIHATGVPASLAGYTDTYAKRAVLTAVNNWITNVATQLFGNLTVIDAYSPYTNPTTGGPLAGVTTDGLHPNDYGINVICQRAISSGFAFPWSRKDYFGGYEDYSNLMNNRRASESVIFAKGGGLGGGTSVYYSGNGTGGIGAGSVTSGWYATNNYAGAGMVGTWSVVARTDNVAGSWARTSIASGVTSCGVSRSFNFSTKAYTSWAATTAATVDSTVITPTGGNNGFCYLAISGGTTGGGTEPSWPTSVGLTVTDGTVTWVAQHLPSPGDVLGVRVELRFPTAAQKGVYVCKLSSSGVAYTVGYCFNLSSTLNTFPAGIIVAEFPDFTMPAGAVTDLLMRISANATGGTSVDMDVGRCMVWVKSRASFPL